MQPVPLFLVIPVPRHWDPAKLIINSTLYNIFDLKTGFQCQALE
ncbi:MAG: WPE palindromic element domain-containing protein [Wolbachia sp.]